MKVFWKGNLSFAIIYIKKWITCQRGVVCHRILYERVMDSPAGVSYFLEVGTIFNEVGVTGCHEARVILRQVEQEEFLDKNRFID